MIAVKGRFHAPKENLYGILVILYSEETMSINNAMVAVGSNNEIYRTPTQKKYHEFETKIQDIIISRKHSATVSSQIEDDLKKLTYNDYLMDKFHKSIASKNGSKIYAVMEEILTDRIHDDGLNLEISLEEYNADAETSGPASAPEPDKGIYVPVKLIISPINGKPIQSLGAGNIIMVQPDKEQSSGMDFISRYNLKNEDGGVVPIPAEILENKTLGNGREIIVRLDKNANGKILEEEKVLVRLYSPSKDPLPLYVADSLQMPSPPKPAAPKASQQKEIPEKPKSNPVFVATFAGIALILIIAAAFIFATI